MVADKAKRALAPVFLLCCLVFGGSGQGIWQNALLQLAAIIIIAVAAAAPSVEPLPAPATKLLYLALAAMTIIALQQVPVPPAVWAHGARAKIAADYSILGTAPPWFPVSLTPFESLSTFLCLLPPLAIYVAIIRLKAFRQSWLAVALLSGTIVGIMLGAVQRSGAGQNSNWYPYSETNLGSAVGFFANANHMAILLVIGLPFVAALAAEVRGRGVQRSSALLAILGMIALLLIAGIILNGSFAGFSLLVPVLAASLLIILPPASRLRKFAMLLSALSLIGAVALMATTSPGSGKIGREAATAVQSRETILETTSRAIADYMPFGSGLGSFLRVYRLYEDPAKVTNEYVIHAHDDYAELTLELGIPGIVLILLFLAWWFHAALDVWRNGNGGAFARAATIASAAILIHSIVDFPLRTAAISACFAVCLALLSERRKPTLLAMTDLRPVRHLVFE